MSETITRDVKLFVAGNYPDKGCNFTEADLDAWIENSGERIPFNIAHLELGQNPLTALSEFGMGWVGKLYRKGKELFGKLHVPETVNRLFDLSSVRGLSVGLGKERDRIEEVSWTPMPRVATAQIFHNPELLQFSVEMAFDAEVSLTERERTVRESFYSKYPDNKELGDWRLVREIFDDYVIYENKGKCYRIDYTLSDAGADFAEPVHVRIDYVPVQEVEMAKEPEVKAGDGEDVKFSELKTELASEKAAREASDARVAELEKNQASDRLAFQRKDDESKLKDLVVAGKITPAHAETLLQFSELTSPAKFTFAEGKEPEEMRPMDAILKFFEGYEPAKVIESAPKPQLRLVENEDTVDYKFTDEEQRLVDKELREKFADASEEVKAAFVTSRKRTFAALQERAG